MDDSKIVTDTSLYQSAAMKLKIVTVGNGVVGKTSLLITYLIGEFPTVFTPHLLEAFTKDVVVDERDATLLVFDTGGGEDYYRLRPLCYPETDAFLLCYSIETRLSFEDIKTIWFPELKHYCPNVPVVLVANKVDLRNNDEFVKRLKQENKSLVTKEEGLKLAEEIGAVNFIECSSKMQINVKEVFNEAVRHGLARNTRKTRENCLTI